MYSGQLTGEVIKALDAYEEKFGEQYALMEVSFETDSELIADIKHHIDMEVKKVYKDVIGEI